MAIRTAGTLDNDGAMSEYAKPVFDAVFKV